MKQSNNVHGTYLIMDSRIEGKKRGARIFRDITVTIVGKNREIQSVRRLTFYLSHNLMFSLKQYHFKSNIVCIKHNNRYYLKDIKMFRFIIRIRNIVKRNKVWRKA